MKKRRIGLIVGCIIGAILIAAGVIAGIRYGFSIDGIRNVATKAANERYAVENVCQTIEIEADAGDVKVIAADTETISVAYFTDEKISVTISEQAGKLTVTQTIKSLPFPSYGGEITVTLPQRESGYAVNVELNAGTLTLNGLRADSAIASLDAGELVYENCTAESAELNADAGRITLRNCTATVLQSEVNAGQITGTGVNTDRATLSVDTGEIDVQIIGTESEYTLTGKVSLGECNFSDRTGATDKYVTAEADAGSITVHFVSP